MTKKDEMGGSYGDSPRAAVVVVVFAVLTVSTVSLVLVALVAVLTGGLWNWLDSVIAALMILFIALCGVRLYAWLVHNRPYPRSFWEMVWWPFPPMTGRTASPSPGPDTGAGSHGDDR